MGSEAQTGFFPAEGHSDAQVSMRGSVGQQFRTRAMASFGLLAYLFSHPLGKKTVAFFYRPIFVTAVMRSEVVAVVLLHRPVPVTADMGSGVVAVVPLRRPVSVTVDVESGVVVIGNRRGNGFR